MCNAICGKPVSDPGGGVVQVPARAICRAVHFHVEWASFQMRRPNHQNHTRPATTAGSPPRSDSKSNEPECEPIMKKKAAESAAHIVISTPGSAHGFWGRLSGKAPTRNH